VLLHVKAAFFTGIATHIGKPAGEGAKQKVVRSVSARGNLDIFDPHTKFFGGDLAHRGVNTLAAFTLAT